MAEQSQSTQEKTEKASPQKLKKARDEGQVARSRDMATAVGIMSCLLMIALLVPTYLQDLRKLFIGSFVLLDGRGTLENAWSTLFGDTMSLLYKMILPLAAIPLAIVIGSLIPGGWIINSKHLVPKFNRLSPIKNLGKLFTGKHAVGVLTSILKAATLLAVLYYIARANLEKHLGLQGMPLDQALLNGGALLFQGVIVLGMVFVLFALIDVPVQKFFFLREQRMSKQDVKEEHKTSEGRPEVKQRIRQLQNQIARRSIRKTVPTADVLVVNPEHYAVALKYDEKRAEAPFLVAKGVDEMALYMREVAREHGVEIVTAPPLARAIYNTSQVHQQIPASLYGAVAKVLNYVLQLEAFQAGRRAAPPEMPFDLAVPSHLT